MIRVTLLICLLIPGLTACNSVIITVQDKAAGGRSDTVAPTFEARQDYWLFGLLGARRIDVKEICGDGTVSRMQALDTASDLMWTAVTLGIYRPRTAKVWCRDADSK